MNDGQKQKIIIAVHGIGDQIRSETIQAVALQLCRYCGAPASMPLGRFTAELVPAMDDDPLPGAFLVQSPPDPQFPVEIGFGEVYWAAIPRGPATDRYTLEETRKWARTIVERVRAMDQARQGSAEHDPQRYQSAVTVIRGLIQAIHVLQRLCALADRAGLFKVDLETLLVNYLGDVQVVTEFRNYRDSILRTFERVFGQVHRKYPQAEIHVVAHSEGTVIAFLGLLRAWHAFQAFASTEFGPPKPEHAWAEQVRGFMTIGSPIDKHLFLWPELWNGISGPAGLAPEEPIRWRNYYDFGDPVGFELDEARNWLAHNGWKGYFEFREEDDIGFTRYVFPGKAHTDYWDDAGVFGHFFQEVVKRKEVWTGTPSSVGKPRTKRWAWWTSRLTPYLMALGLLILGTFLLYKAIAACHQIEESLSDFSSNVAGIALLLSGVTAAARVPRLTQDLLWRVGSWLYLAVTLAAFPFVISEGFQDRLGALSVLIPWDLPDVEGTFAGVRITTLAVLAGACVVLVLVCLVSARYPTLGSIPLVVLGSVFIFGILWLRVAPESPYGTFVKYKQSLAEQTRLRGEALDRGASMLVNKAAAERKRVDPPSFTRAKLSMIEQTPGMSKATPKPAPPFVVGVHVEAPQEAMPALKGAIWPVFVAGAAFLYLWWAAALVFDLVVVWHHWVKGGALMRRLKG